MAALNRFIFKVVEKSLPFFKVLRKINKFEWDASYQQAFEELKKYLAGLPLLVKPTQGDTLYLYLSVIPQAIGFVLVHEEEGKQMLIYYVSKVLNGAEDREYGISCLPRTTIKAQALADFIFEMAGISPGETPKVEKWLLHMDGSSTIQGSDAGIVDTSPHGEDLEFAVKFDFKASNIEVEYETLLIGMKMVHEAGAKRLVAYSDSQKQNIKADCLSKRASSLEDYQTRNIAIEYLLEPRAPLAIQGIDIVDPFLLAFGQRKFLLVAIDDFTKWVEAEPLARITEGEVKKFIWINIICRFGLPREIISDNGRKVEVTNRILVQGIKRTLEKVGGNWTEELTGDLWAYRTTPRGFMVESLFTLVYGTEAIISVD
ncbi:hypothetical protein Sango_1564100 [Sesamum angolense]|uniref:Integrase catalytic domain-containing protein n=1 Tax=Sesamum angolense TaxID=2727404 RepID=A0AAE1WPU9_9LAMI|nr:hypothetical protein Sango_1564100 [Sesamum angolense]